MRWKSVERAVAKYIGGERVPITGRQRGDEPDIKHWWLSVEVKTRAKVPEWIKDAGRQAAAAKKREDQLPVVILHEKHQAIKDSLVIVRAEDFMDWFGDVSEIIQAVMEAESE